jgi:WD40 repeat protein
VIEPGDSIPLKIEQGLESSRTLLLVMSHGAFASEWVTLERHTALFRDPTNQQRRFIPLRLDDAEINDSLRQFAYVDWRGKDEGQYAKLVAACRPPAEEAKRWRPSATRLDARLFSLGHTGPIMGVALTGDGRRAVSGSSDNTVRVWDTESGQCLATLEGHTDEVNGVALTGDGRRAVSGSDDHTVRVWDTESGQCLATLEGHTASVFSVALTGDGRRAVSGSSDQTVRVWDTESGECLAMLEGHADRVRSVALTGDGRRAVSGSDDHTVRVWDTESGECLATLHGHTARVRSVVLTGDGRRAVSGSWDHTVRVWDTESGQCLATLQGHTNEVNSVALSGDGRRAVSGCSDNTVRVWDTESGQCLATLEGHTDEVNSVALTGDGRRAVSGSDDKTVRVWDTESGQCLATLEGHTDEVNSVALTGDGRRAVSAAVNGVARIWDGLPTLEPTPATESASTRYTNAKVLLVGESGVGKTGLAIQLTQGRFEATVSSDAHWATRLPLPHQLNTEAMQREIWLWDFAGQADYRLIQQLFLDETALAVLVFNPQNENPFEGLGHWDHGLTRAARRTFKKLLVAGRCDRGGLMVSRRDIEQFAAERGFAEYLETSAFTGDGCRRLHEAIVENIDWESIPYVSSPRIFKLLKDEILRMRDEEIVLLRMGELKQQLELRLPGEVFSLDELRAVVGLLAGPGIVWRLEFGDLVLLQPEWINTYAAAVVRSVRSQVGEIGVIPEEEVLAGRLNYTLDRRPGTGDPAPEEPGQEPAQRKAETIRRLPSDKEPIVLRAMHQTFVDHGLCLREHTERGTQLVLPSYFRRELPGDPGHPPVLVSYRFNGHANEIYATLVVQLHHTKAFENDQLWRYAADFKSPAGKRMGLKMTKGQEGSAELSVYFDPAIQEDTQVTFIKYVHEHLLKSAQDVKRERCYVCKHCAAPVENQRTVQKRLHEGKQDILCVDCEKRVPLWDLIEEKFASDEFRQRVRELEERAKAGIDNESRELILIGHAFAIAGEAGQIFRPTPNSDWGIDGEIEFKDYSRNASGKRVYLQLKSGDSYLHTRRSDGAEVFRIKKARWAEYWQQQAYPVMLVIRTSDGTIRWMDVSAYLKRESQGRKTAVKQVVFDGEPFSALSLLRMRDRLIPPPA